jgi:hypothetical protein
LMAEMVCSACVILAVLSTDCFWRSRSLADTL